MKCCMGFILEVDLSTGEIQRRKVPNIVYEQVLSGKGLGVWYLYNHIPAGADPWGPENVLGLVSGALTGTGALYTGRWMAVCKSPLTGGWGDANCGGNFSPAIKQCGVDGIFFRGISSHPVYLWMDNKGAELRDASPYWGLDAVEAGERLTNDTQTQKKPRVAVIGQAGENRSCMAGIVHDGGRLAARSGVGGVMGSKKLKAVVLAGTRQVPCADRKTVRKQSKILGALIKKADIPFIFRGSVLPLLGKLLASSKYVIPSSGTAGIAMQKKWGTPMTTSICLQTGDAPVKNWGGSKVDIKKDLDNYNPDHISKVETMKYHCYACGQGCGGILDISGLGTEFHYTHKPEYETINAFGPLLMNKDLSSILYINELLNRAGMDSISAGNTIAYAIECYENNLISQEQLDGLDLHWSNADAIIAITKKMIHREGCGNYLADGVKRAVDYFGEETKKYAMHVGGAEPGMHDTRFDPQLAVHYVADPAPGKHTTGMLQSYSSMELSKICSWAIPVIKHRKDDDYLPNNTIAQYSMASACYTMLLDGVGGCMFGGIIGISAWNLVDYLNAAAGWRHDGDHYMEIGKRIQNLRQMFNIKQGIDPRNVKLPNRMAGIPPLNEGPLKGKTLQMEKQVSLHWKAFGWDENTGAPMTETVKQLGIPELLAVEVE